MINIRAGVKKDLPSVIELHSRSFQGFFLTILGGQFLRQLYKGFLDIPTGFLFVLEEKSSISAPSVMPQIIGFVAGCCVPQVFFHELRRTRWLMFLLAALPSLILRPGVVLRRLIGAVTYRGDVLQDLNGYWLLSSLAVDPTMSGQGHGTKLIQRFCEVAFQDGAAGVYLTTDAVGNDSVRGFYVRNGFIVKSKLKRSNGREMILYVRDFNHGA